MKYIFNIARKAASSSEPGLAWEKTTKKKKTPNKQKNPLNKTH